MRIGDFSLNIANELSADLFVRQGLSRLVPSYDLNWDQFRTLLVAADPSVIEAVIHQHMPMFHMEHCVFAATLSDGKDWRDCGRPCDRHQVELKDRMGANFPLLADAGCRNTVFNAVPQSGAEYLARMLNLGVRHFRLDLLRETPSEVRDLVQRYCRVLSGEEDGRNTWRSLQVLNQLGVTRGTLDG
jgi:putative protease